jgi:hypothetical protein
MGFKHHAMIAVRYSLIFSYALVKQAACRERVEPLDN